MWWACPIRFAENKPKVCRKDFSMTALAQQHFVLHENLVGARGFEPPTT
jgi:hypothetical protein